MKPTFALLSLLFIASATYVISCSSKNPKAELESLKTQKAAIEKKIEELEKQFKSDSGLVLEISATELKPEIFKLKSVSFNYAFSKQKNCRCSL